MILINTTFFIDKFTRSVFIDWVNNIYLPEIIKSKLFHSQELFEILPSPDPDNISFAFQLRSDKETEAAEWYEKIGENILSSIVKNEKDKILYFTTVMKRCQL